jgi:hypothetical protein
MSKLIGNGVTHRSLRLVFSLALLGVTLGLTFFPGKACALWAEKTTETYYFDAAKTQYAGRCVDNGCTGSYICSGQETEYVRVTVQIISCPGGGV